MPLSTTTQEELRAELAAIETMRKQMNQKLDARIEAIKAVLEPFDFSQSQLPFVVPENAAKQESTATGNLRVVGHAPTGLVGAPSKFASTGLRAAILEALRDHGPMRAPAIAKILELNGFKNDSKTPLATRVYNDCWRMIERKMVENNEGIFSLRKTA